MGFFNTSEPLGLPRGSVRAVIAILMTVAFIYRFAAGLPVDPALLTLESVILTFYFVKRSDETRDTPVVEKLPEPVVD